METVGPGSTLAVQGLTPYSQVPRWILRAGDALSHGSVRLYGVIMSYADNDTKTAFPSRETLAQDMGASVTTVKRSIRELEDFGAIVVERRRNKRTGNFYANHYTLVFQNPWVTDDPRRRVTDGPITTPTISTTPTSSTSEETPEAVLHLRSDDQGRARAARADPVSPDFYASEDRQTLLANVQAIATAGSAQKEIAIDQFAHNLTIAFDGDDLLDYLIWDRDWQPPKKCSDRFEAAKWFNTFLNAWKIEAGELRWRDSMSDR